MDYMEIGERHAALYVKPFERNTEGCKQERIEKVAVCLAKARTRILGLIGVNAAMYQAGFLRGLGL